MKGSSYDDITLKQSYAAYDIDLENIDFSDIEIPAAKIWDDDQMLMNLIDAHALIAEIAIQLGSTGKDSSILGMVNLLERMSDETAVAFQATLKKK
jgi:hypothetical protein|tara:strand:- start:162 stop:449 length:288 start_codon:yes stop_codon:yes gene_type:complete